MYTTGVGVNMPNPVTNVRKLLVYMAPINHIGQSEGLFTILITKTFEPSHFDNCPGFDAHNSLLVVCLLIAGYVLERFIKQEQISNHQGLTPLVNMDNCNWCPLLQCWWKVRRKLTNLVLPTAAVLPTVSQIEAEYICVVEYIFV